MLPAAHRLREATQYRAVLRAKGAGRAGASLLAVHAVDTDAIGLPPQGRTGPRVGFVVSKAVGNAVVRARTKRILRHLMLARLSDLPASFDFVVRAQPAIAGKSSAEIDAELGRMLTKACSRARRPAGASA